MIGEKFYREGRIQKDGDTILKYYKHDARIR